MTFAYADFERQYQDRMIAAQEEAQLLIDEAAEQAEQALDDARQNGFAEGTRQAEAEFEAKVEAEVQSRLQQQLDQLMPALQSVTSQLTRDHEQILLHWESRLVHLSLALAERIVHRELHNRPGVPRELVADVLQWATGSSCVRLRVHPDDARAMENNSADWRQIFSNHSNLQIAADPAISVGGCLLETTAGEIDGRIETQLSRIAQELLGEGP